MAQGAELLVAFVCIFFYGRASGKVIDAGAYSKLNPVLKALAIDLVLATAIFFTFSGVPIIIVVSLANPNMFVLLFNLVKRTRNRAFSYRVSEILGGSLHDALEARQSAVKDVRTRATAMIKRRDRPLIIGVVGNIGASKTTLLKALHTRDETGKSSLYLEQIELWKRFLKHFYHKTIAAGSIVPAFELNIFTHFFATLCDIVTDKDRPDVALVERTPGCTLLFLKAHVNNKVIPRWLYDLTRTYVDALDLLWDPDLYIWLDTPPEECMKRVQERSGAGDSGVQIEYLESLHRVHVAKFGGRKKRRNVVRIHGAGSREEIEEAAAKAVERFLVEHRKKK